MKDNTYILIMAGGVGSRFWPKSRNSFPKQFIDILGTGESLLQLTYQRFLKISNPENIYILTNQDYESLVIEQLKVSPSNVLLEPCRNNTAPCIAYASAKIKSLNENANIVVAPSDHLILKEEVFLDKINTALAYAAKNDALLTLGITPTRPDTGYGYIKFAKTSDEVKKVEAFMEKPRLEKARLYVESGEYLWNAGIFIWSVKSIQNALQRYTNSTYELFKNGQTYYGTDQESSFIKDNYPLAENISIDFALMEKADNVYTIPADIGWSDLGTWASLHEVTKHKNNNSINTPNALLQDTEDCIISVNNQKAVLVNGLKDYIVVDDDNVLLIYPKSKEQEIKALSGKFVEEFGAKFS